MTVRSAGPAPTAKVLGKQLRGDDIAKANTEHGHQSAYFAELAIASPQIWRATFAIPNGRKRSPIDGGILKKEGVKAGVPDVFVSWPVAPYAGLFIEFKRPADADTKRSKGSTQANQDDWIAELRGRAYAATHVFSWREAMEATSLYFAGTFSGSHYARR